MTETSSGKINKEEHLFKSTSGVCDIHTVLWYPDKEKYENPVGVVQIAHGMIDHIERFEGLALYLAERGFVVAGNDHLGHGDSVNDKNDWGYFAKGNNSGLYLVKDMHKLTIIMKKRFPELPYILIGHSMGSFMTRRYLMMYGNELDAAVILGTGNQPKIMVDGGLLAVKFTKLFHGDRYRSETLNKMMFGTYNNRIENPVTDSDWLTRNPDIVDNYVNDEKCSFLFTVNAYEGMLKIIRYVINDANIEKAVKEADLVIGCVLIPGKSAPKIFKKKYLKEMKPGAVFVDVAVDQGGCGETTKVTYHDDPIFIEDGVVHYCVGNMPGAVPRTSTIALTNATLSYGLQIAGKGLEQACKDNEVIFSAINTYDGKLTCKNVADSYDCYEYADIHTLV